MSNPKQVIVVRKDLNMRKGKIAAQVAHAAMMFLSKNAEIFQLHPRDEYEFAVTITPVQQAWLVGKFAKITPYVDSEAELRALIEKARAAGIVVHECIDAGLTEFHGVETLTCAAFGPDLPEKLDPITRHLQLL